VVRAIIHFTSDQPLAVELDDLPAPGDGVLICRNVRTVDGKRPVFVDYPESTFVFPYSSVFFVEIHTGVGRGKVEADQAAAGEAEPEDLEIDEDFLRRIREA
jgi:hypothetical protein